MSSTKLPILALAAALALNCSGVALKADSTAATPATAEQKVPKYGANETVIFVGDMHCSNCAKSVSSKLFKVKGVLKVRTDVKADVAIVTPQSKKKVDPLALWKAAKEAGFPAVKLISPSGTYLADAETKEPKLQPKAAEAPKS